MVLLCTWGRGAGCCVYTPAREWMGENWSRWVDV